MDRLANALVIIAFVVMAMAFISVSLFLTTALWSAFLSVAG